MLAQTAPRMLGAPEMTLPTGRIEFAAPLKPDMDADRLAERGTTRPPAPDSHVAPVPASIALQRLTSALSELAATLPKSTQDYRMINGVLKNAGALAAGTAAFSARLYCSGADGLSLWLDHQPRSSAVTSTKNTLIEVCASRAEIVSQALPATSATPLQSLNPGLGEADADYQGLLVSVTTLELAPPPTLPLQPPLQIDPHDDCSLLSVRKPSGGVIYQYTDDIVAPYYYELSAYQIVNDVAILEEGDRIAPKQAAHAGCKTSKTYDRLNAVTSQTNYGSRLTFLYKGKMVTKDYVGPNGSNNCCTYDTEFKFPDDMIPSGNAPTNVTMWYQTAKIVCSYPGVPGSGNCVVTPLGAINGMLLQVQAFGAMCTASYQYTDFTVNDRNDVSFKDNWYSTSVSAISGNGVFSGELTSSEFHGTGYHVEADGVTSSYPLDNDIIAGQRFAVHADDPVFSVYGKNKKFGDPHTRAQYIEQVGALNISALRFPRATTRNILQSNKQFSYACTLPPIKRDFVALCTAKPDLKVPDSSYLLPYKGTKNILQGNFGPYSHYFTAVPLHDERFAWDFTTLYSPDQKIYAARSGWVTKVVQRFDGNTAPWGGQCVVDDPANPTTTIPNPNGCQANIIVVRHSDDTEAHYLHLEHHGALVSEGQFVHRGDTLANSGSVGSSFEQHIHFEIKDAIGNHESMAASLDTGGGPCIVPEWTKYKQGTLTDGLTTEYEFLHNPDYYLPFKR